MNLTEEADHRTAAVGELMKILLAQNDCAGATQAADNFGVFSGNAVLEQRAGGGGADSSGIENVFQSGGNAVQGPEIGSAVDFALGDTGSFKSGFRCDRGVCVKPGGELFDEGQAGVPKVGGRE